MNPCNFYIIVSALILLQLPLIGICKWRESYIPSIFPSDKPEFYILVFRGFEWMMTDTVQKKFVWKFNTEIYNNCFLLLNRLLISDLSYSVQTL